LESNVFKYLISESGQVFEFRWNAWELVAVDDDQNNGGVDYQKGQKCKNCATEESKRQLKK
jgi:hypothetical protein